MSIPKKLQPGSHIRVVAPARSLNIIGEDRVRLAVTKLENAGLKVTFSKNVNEQDVFDSSSISSRIDDLHEAFNDSSIDGILTAIGGYNSNQLLSHLDYKLIAANPKIFCGYSDITALSNAIYAKTKLVTYSGPHFSSFSMIKGFEYTLEYFLKCAFEVEQFELKTAEEWSDDVWYINQEDREFIPNKGPKFLHSRVFDVEGVSIGGNIGCFHSLQGTEYFPGLLNKILLLEADEETSPVIFDRQLESILQQSDASTIKCILLGRFPKRCKMSQDFLLKILHAKSLLKKIPVLYDLDFGHTSPMFTFPVGGKINVRSNGGNPQLFVEEF